MADNKLNLFESAIKEYLDERAQNDSAFAERYTLEGKSIQECCKFIKQEVGKKRDKGEDCVAMTDNEVYGLAVHYYDEDDIKVDDTPAQTKVAVQVVTETKSPSNETPKKRKPRAQKEVDKNVPFQLDIPLFQLT